MCMTPNHKTIATYHFAQKFSFKTRGKKKAEERSIKCLAMELIPFSFSSAPLG